jgi:hypothetical protein
MEHTKNMRQLAITLVFVFSATALIAGCEPEPCRDFRDLICKTCGTSSAACKEVKKRRGRDEKKCIRGVKHVKSRIKSEKGRKTLCTLLNSDLTKKRTK